MFLRVRLLCDGGSSIQEHKISGVTRESAKQEGDVNDESAEFGVWQQIIDRVLVTNGIWHAVNQTKYLYKRNSRMFRTVQ